MRFAQNLIDRFKPVDQEMIAFYQSKMPDFVDAEIGFDKERNMVFAKLLGFDNDDILFTQAKNRTEMEEMVNDAIATYYEIPYRYIPHLLISKRYIDRDLRRTKKAVKTA